MNKIIHFFIELAYWLISHLGFKASKDWVSQLVKYLFVGVAATIIDFVFLYALTEWLGFWYLLSATISFILAAAANYVLNKIWTFQNKDKKIARQFMIFIGVAIVGLAINNSILYVGVEYFGLWYMFSKVLATVASLIWNFIGHKYITFRVHN